MGKSYREQVSKWDKPSKKNNSDAFRRDQERKEKALMRTIGTMKGMTKGFTLVELMVVIVFIVAILAGISLLGGCGCGYVGLHFLQKVW